MGCEQNKAMPQNLIKINQSLKTNEPTAHKPKCKRMQPNDSWHRNKTLSRVYFLNDE